MVRACRRADQQPTPTWPKGDSFTAWVTPGSAQLHNGRYVEGGSEEEQDVAHGGSLPGCGLTLIRQRGAEYSSGIIQRNCDKSRNPLPYNLQGVSCLFRKTLMRLYFRERCVPAPGIDCEESLPNLRGLSTIRRDSLRVPPHHGPPLWIRLSARPQCGECVRPAAGRATGDFDLPLASPCRFTARSFDVRVCTIDIIAFPRSTTI